MDKVLFLFYIPTVPRKLIILTNNILTNNILTNIILTNNILTNNILTNNILTNNILGLLQCLLKI